MALAESFATLVGLLIMFRDERDKSKTATKEEFEGWLAAHKHEEIKRLVVENGAIGMAIDAMMRDQQGELMRQLADLNKITTGIAHNLESLSGLAAAVDKHAPQLSEQSVSFLRQFNAINASKAIEAVSSAGHQFIFADGAGHAQLAIDDPRFLEDDIQQLANLGLLILDYNSQGGKVIKITRAGAALGHQPAPTEV